MEIAIILWIQLSRVYRVFLDNSLDSKKYIYNNLMRGFSSFVWFIIVYNIVTLFNLPELGLKNIPFNHKVDSMFSFFNRPQYFILLLAIYFAGVRYIGNLVVKIFQEK